MKILKTKWYVTEKISDKRHVVRTDLGVFSRCYEACSARASNHLQRLRVRSGQEMIELRDNYGVEYIEWSHPA